ADFYGAEFARAGLTERIRLPAEPYRHRGLTNHHVYNQYVVRTPKRDALRGHLSKREIETAIYYPLGLHEQKCFVYLGYKKGDFPETERAARETLALPIYPEISREAQRYVVEAIVEFLKYRRQGRLRGGEVGRGGVSVNQKGGGTEGARRARLKICCLSAFVVSIPPLRPAFGGPFFLARP